MSRTPFGATLALAIDSLRDPVAIVRDDGQLVFANIAMRGLVRTAELLLLRDGRITGISRPVTRAVYEAVQTTVMSGRSAMAVITGAHGAAPIIVRVAPLAIQQERAFGPEERLFCLVVEDPGRVDWAATGDAMLQFGLTRREAAVGALLAAGLTVDEIAGRLALSRNTIRSHLAALRDKFGVHSALAVAAQMRHLRGPFA